MEKEQVWDMWERAKGCLKKKNLSLKLYASESGISDKTVYSQIQSGVMPDADDFLRLASLTETDPYWLMWGDNPPCKVKRDHSVYEEDIEKLEKQMQELIDKLRN